MKYYISRTPRYYYYRREKLLTSCVLVFTKCVLRADCALVAQSYDPLAQSLGALHSVTDIT